MEPEEARDILSDMRDQHLQFIDGVENTGTWGEKFLKEAWACDFGAKTLEKQIPMKVLYEDVGYDFHRDENLYACICPSCGLHIIEFSDEDVDSKCNSDIPEDMFRSSMVHHAYIGMNNYCNRCGQKLDWGEENGR
mgnify:CR=1 FL=1